MWVTLRGGGSSDAPRLTTTTGGAGPGHAQHSMLFVVVLPRGTDWRRAISVAGGADRWPLAGSHSSSELLLLLSRSSLLLQYLSLSPTVRPYRWTERVSSAMVILKGEAT